MKLDAEFKDEKLSSLQRELQEMQDGGASEDEVRQLKKQKHELEMRLKDQVIPIIPIKSLIQFI